MWWSVNFADVLRQAISPNQGGLVVALRAFHQTMLNLLARSIEHSGSFRKT